MAPALTLLATLVALAGAALALALEPARENTRIIVPFSGGILLGVAVFDLFPELVRATGFAAVLALFAAGYGVLFFADRFEQPGWRPLVIVAAVHAFFDGWGISSAAQSTQADIRLGVAVAVLLHKFPEGLSLGGMLRNSAASRWRAFGWCFAAESATLAGGAVGLAITRGNWAGYPVAVAGGCFVYLGLHAVRGEWKRRGALPALVPALLGVAGAVGIEHWARALAR